MGHDLVIRNARLRSGEPAEIGISDGCYAEIAVRIAGQGTRELDAEEGLVTESYVIAQQHLDKVFTGAWVGATTRGERTP